MKNYLRMTVRKSMICSCAVAALAFGFSGSASAHPALAMMVAPQVIQFLPQILPIFGGIFSGGGMGMAPLPYGASQGFPAYENDGYNGGNGHHRRPTHRQNRWDNPGN